MDLEFLGRKDLGDYFLERYAVHSGDRAPSSLRDFYIAYRAVVRAKVDCVRASQGKSEAAKNAARHLAIATQYLENGSVRLALIAGNPGTGKSTVARALAEKVGAQVISTDDVRRELRVSGVITGDPGVLDAGLYRRNNVRMVYEVALHRAPHPLGRWAIGHPRRHLAASTNSRSRSSTCYGNPFCAGGTHVLYDGGYGRR